MKKPEMTVPHDLWLALGSISAEAIAVTLSLLREEGERMKVDLDNLFLVDGGDGEDAPAVAETIYDRLAAIEEVGGLLGEMGAYAERRQTTAAAYWATEWPALLAEVRP